MKKIIFCLSAVLSLFIIFSLSAYAEIDFSEEAAKALETVSDPDVCESFGDCDNSGTVSLTDARKVLRAAIGIDDLTEEQIVRADVDNNDKITVLDARKILRIAIGTDEQSGHQTVNLTIVPATCSTKGYSIKYCTVCLKKYSEWTKYDKNTHLGGWVTVAEATCKNDGLKQYKCQLCNKVLEQKVITKSNSKHKYGEWIYPNGNNCKVDTERYRICTLCGYKQEDLRTATFHVLDKEANPATCTENGIAKCKYCDYTETIKATGHLYNSVNLTVYKKATCTETGLKANLCVNCGEPREGTIETIPALGHSYDESKQKVVTEPTCSSEGKAKVFCTSCGLAKEITLDKTEHTLTKDWSIITAAKCTTDGLKTATCKYCGTLTEVIPATGHTGTWNITKATSCKEAGLKTRTCTACGEIETEVIEQLAHTFPTTIKQSYYCNITKEPNCIEKGEAVLKCTKCGETKTVILEIDETAHVRSDDERIISEATCQQGAIYSHYCTVCDKNIGTTSHGRKLAHQAGEDWIITGTPSCTTAGTREKQCIYCNMTMETEEISATGHINTTVTKGSYDINGVCKTIEICNDCKQTVKEGTFSKITVNGGTVTFSSNSTTTFKAGDVIIFTIEENNVDSINVACGIHNDSLTEESGVYQYTIPEGIEDDDIITFNIYTAYEEE